MFGLLPRIMVLLMVLWQESSVVQSSEAAESHLRGRSRGSGGGELNERRRKMRRGRGASHVRVREGTDPDAYRRKYWCCMLCANTTPLKRLSEAVRY